MKKEKENNTLAWLLGIGFIWVLAGRTAYTALRLAFKLVGLRLVSISQENTKINLDIAIRNPTAYNVIVRDIYCTLYLNDVAVGQISQIVNRRITAKGITVITIQATVFNSELMQQFVQQLQSGIYDNWTVRVAGSVSADNSRYPFDVFMLAEDIIG